MSQPIQGLAIGLALDTSGIEPGLKDLRRQMGLLNSEMSANMSAFDRGEKSVEKYQAKLTGLTNKLNLQRTTTERARTEYDRMVDAHGAGSRQAEIAGRAYNNHLSSLNNLERQVNSVNDEFQEFERQQRISSSALGTFASDAERMGGRLSKVGSGLKTVGSNMSLFITAPLVGIAGASVDTAKEFEAQMDRVGAIAGATADDMKALEQSALDLGASTSKSASEVAIAQEGLAAMGFNTNEIIGAMPGVIAAAEASGADMAQTADVMASSLNIFGLEAEEANRVADVLAQTANQSAADITDMQYALKYAGSPAAALGVSLEELSASIGIMTDSGMKGEQAGTTLRAALLGLLDPSEENSKMMETMGVAITDNEGNFVGLSNLVENLSDSMEGQTDTQKAATLAQLVGTEAVSGMLSLMAAGPEKIDTMTKSLEESEGASKKAADMMKDNLSGSLDELGGAFETAAITIGDKLIPFIRDATGYVQGFVEKFIEADPAVQNTILAIGGIAAVAGPMVLAAGGIASAIGGILSATAPVITAIAGAGGLGASFGTAATAIGAFATGPVGIAIGAFAAIAGGAILLDQEMDKPIIKSDIFAGKISEATQEAVGSYVKLDDDATAELNSLAWSQQTITDEMASSMVERYRTMGDQILLAMQENHNAQLTEQQRLFDESSILSEEEEAKRIAKLNAKQAEEEKTQNAHQARINEIWTKAADEKRGITEGEAAEIAGIQSQMRMKAVEELSGSQKEQETILRNLKTNKGIIETETAAKTVSKAVETREKVVKEAEKEYRQTVAAAESGRDELGTISSEEATKIIKEAERKRNKVVSKAEDMHSDVVREAKKQSGDHVSEVDWETGQVLSGWDRMYNGVLTAVNWVRGLFGNEPKEKKGSVKENGRQTKKRQNAEISAHANGTLHGTHKGGPALVGEEGPELAYVPNKGMTLVGARGPEIIKDLPQGSAVLPNKHTNDVLRKYNFPGYAEGVGDWSVFDLITKGASGVWDVMKDKFGIGDSLLSSGYKNAVGGATGYIGGLAVDWASGLIKDFTSSLISSGSGTPLTGGNGGGFGAPFRLSSRPGPRNTGIAGASRMHKGWDWAAPVGTPIPSVSDGIVSRNSWNPISGKFIEINSGNRTHRYQHNSRNLVDVGQTVRKGQTVALVGATGVASGPHLHYELKGFADGGLVTKEQLAMVGEGGKEEVIIPVGDPNKRTNAMKLLALAAKKLGANNGGSVSSAQIPSTNVGGNGAIDALLSAAVKTNEFLMQQNELLLQLLQKDGNVYMESGSLVGVIGNPINEQLGNSSRNSAYMRGDRL